MNTILKSKELKIASVMILVLGILAFFLGFDPGDAFRQSKWAPLVVIAVVFIIANGTAIIGLGSVLKLRKSLFGQPQNYAEKIEKRTTIGWFLFVNVISQLFLSWPYINDL